MTAAEGLVLMARYPCCEKRCRVRAAPAAATQGTVERNHYCNAEDETGTRWAITWRLVRTLQRPDGGTAAIHAVDFVDLASDEAFRLYGRRTVPTRTVLENEGMSR